MHFYSPHILYFLGLLAIPVIIHLLHIRRFIPVYFSNTAFLKNVIIEKKARQKIKKWLLLISRLLFWASLIVAFAGPYLKKNEYHEPASYVDIFIDNSFSMEWRSGEGRAFDRAIKKAAQIIQSYRHSQVKFRLLNFSYDTYFDRYYSAPDAMEILEEIRITPFSLSMDHIWKRINQSEESSSSGSREVFLITDFQRSFITDTALLAKGDSGCRITLLPLTYDKPSNLSVDSCWFQNPVRQLNAADKLYVRVVNYSERSYENITLRINRNGSYVPVSFSIGPYERKVLVWEFTESQPGWVQMKIEIEDEPVVFDDVYYIAYKVERKAKVLCVKETEEPSVLLPVFFNQENVEYTEKNLSAFDFNEAMSIDLLILFHFKHLPESMIALVKGMLSEGKSVVIIPSPSADIDSYNNMMQALGTDELLPYDTTYMPVRQFYFQHPLFQSMFEAIPDRVATPAVRGYFPLQSRRSFALAEYINKYAFLTETSYERGRLFVFSAPFQKESNTFLFHSLFAPLFHVMAMQAASDRERNIFMGSGECLTVKDLIDTRNKIYLEAGEEEIIPEILPVRNTYRFCFPQFPQQAGIYPMMYRDSVLFYLAVNYQRNESNPECWSEEELEKFADQHSRISLMKETLPDVTAYLREKNEGISIAKYFLILALICVVAEIMILKLL